mgnify:CR=1 FL=1
MGENVFNRRQCIRALTKLGFLFDNKRSGKHDKYKSPFSNINPSFIMIPRHNELHCQDAIIKELEKMGGLPLVEKFRHYL